MRSCGYALVLWFVRNNFVLDESGCSALNKLSPTNELGERSMKALVVVCTADACIVVRPKGFDCIVGLTVGVGIAVRFAALRHCHGIDYVYSRHRRRNLKWYRPQKSRHVERRFVQILVADGHQSSDRHIAGLSGRRSRAYVQNARQAVPNE